MDPHEHKRARLDDAQHRGGACIYVDIDPGRFPTRACFVAKPNEIEAMPTGRLDDVAPRPSWAEGEAINGVAGKNISRVDVRFSDGRTAPATSTSARSSTCPAAELPPGHRPAELVGRDARGRVVGRARLPYGGWAGRGESSVGGRDPAPLGKCLQDEHGVRGRQILEILVARLERREHGLDGLDVRDRIRRRDGGERIGDVVRETCRPVAARLRGCAGRPTRAATRARARRRSADRRRRVVGALLERPRASRSAPSQSPARTCALRIPIGRPQLPGGASAQLSW